MTEAITIKKKKKLSIKDAVKLLKPFAENWKRIDKETAEKFYKVYQDCERGIWKYVLEGLGIASSTWYYWMEKYELDIKYPEVSEAKKESFVPTLEQADEDVELEPAQVEDELVTEFDTAKYQETYGILKNAQRLSPNMFKVVEKQELIKELQATIKILNGLLLELESGL